MIFIYLFLLTLVSGIPLNIENSRDANYAWDADLNLEPEKREFPNKKQLFQSLFWKQLTKKKNPRIAASTVIILKDTNSVYYFDDSELKKDRSWLRPIFRRRIDLIEVQYGEKKDIKIPKVPVSQCISSKLSSGGAGYTHSLSWGRTFSLSIGGSIAAAVMNMGVTASLGSDLLTLGLTDTGGITCNANPGKKVQVFGAFTYAYFPEARRRSVCFFEGDEDFQTGPWSKIPNGSPEFEVNGPIFFNLDEFPEIFCVDDKDELQCDSPPVKQMRN